MAIKVKNSVLYKDFYSPWVHTPPMKYIKNESHLKMLCWKQGIWSSCWGVGGILPLWVSFCLEIGAIWGLVRLLVLYRAHDHVSQQAHCIRRALYRCWISELSINVSPRHCAIDRLMKCFLGDRELLTNLLPLYFLHSCISHKCAPCRRLGEYWDSFTTKGGPCLLPCMHRLGFGKDVSSLCVEEPESKDSSPRAMFALLAMCFPTCF